KTAICRKAEPEDNMLRYAILIALVVVAFGEDELGIYERWSKGYKGKVSGAETDCNGNVIDAGCTIDLKFPKKLEMLNSGMAFPTEILNNDRTTWRMKARNCDPNVPTIFDFTADFKVDFRKENFGEGYFESIPGPTVI
ncbi:unnamed protein product, partial [Owenia fusiformis]